MPKLAEYFRDPRADISTPALMLASEATEGTALRQSAANDRLEIDALVANRGVAIGANTATDLILTGTTAARTSTFDASADAWRQADSVASTWGTGNDLSLSHDATNSLITSTTGNLLVESTSATGSILARLGTVTSATSFEVQASDAMAIITATADGVVNVPLARTVQHSAGFLVPCYSNAVHQVLSGPGAMNLTSSYTRWTTTGADAGTLAAPGVAVPAGFIKHVLMAGDSGDGTLTVTGLAAANDVFVFSELGQSLTLMAINATTWVIVGETPGDTTVQSMATFS